MNMKWFLTFVFLLFVGVLVALWVASEAVDPVMLDEQGRPINPPAEQKP